MYKYRLFLSVAVLSMLLGASAIPVYAAAKPIRVPANMEWVNTGILLEAGETVYLSTQGVAITAPINKFSIGSASGPWGQFWNLGCGQYLNAPPPCAMADAPYGALVGRIGSDGTPFLIGGSDSFISSASGILYLAVNDNQEFYGDNLSGFTVVFEE